MKFGLLYCIALFAFPCEASENLSLEKYLDYCFHPPVTEERGFCEGYLQGSIDAIRASSHEKQLICIPETANVKGIIDAIDRKTIDHPDLRRMSIGLILPDILIRLLPCK